MKYLRRAELIKKSGLSRATVAERLRSKYPESWGIEVIDGYYAVGRANFKKFKWKEKRKGGRKVKVK
jgi:hypothetical protein